MRVVKKVKRDRPSNAVESGNRVRDLREQAKMTQEKLRERTGITARTIRTWEAGVRVSQTNRKLILEVLAEVLGLDEARLIAEVEALVARKQSSRRRWSMQQEDLLGLRDLLMSALIGSAVDPGRDPADVEALRERVHGELGRRAMNLCLRHLMVLEADATHIEASTERLRKLLHDLGALEALVRRTAARGTLMRGTLPGASPRSQRKDGVISALLVAIRESADGADRQAWCASYVRDDGAQPVDVDGCARVLAAVLQRARTDIGALRKLCSDAGPLGWVRFGAVASRDRDRVNLLRPGAR